MSAVNATTVTPFLMYEGRAEEAMNLYVSLFPDSRVERVIRYGAEGPGAEGSVMQAVFTLAGQRVMCIDSPIKHEFGFTPATSFFVTLPTEAEIDRCFAALEDGGEVMMPLGRYPFSEKFGWLQDRFGVSWQLSLSTPTDDHS
jgi:predicted 3-demethylubiquinone-9 3-methyltransferase (glyoxalase superfamily)